jgi:Zn-dependent protease with chaperone function
VAAKHAATDDAKSKLLWVRLLGGRVVTQDNATPQEKAVLNALEEITVAASLPAPPELFILDKELRINALAIGVDEQQAAIGVTLGAVEKLSRNEMQALLAQQLGHLIEQDPQLSLRLSAMTASLRLFATFGEMLFMLSAPFSLLNRERREQMQARRRGEPAPEPSGGFLSKNWAIGRIAFAMWMLGWFGAKAGQLLQSRVNREKEFLSDAHAVRLTRNPDSLKAAFEKILLDLDAFSSTEESSEIKKLPYAGSAFSANIAHAFFVSTYAQTRQKQLKGGWFDTHPPLAKRIERLAR